MLEASHWAIYTWVWIFQQPLSLTPSNSRAVVSAQTNIRRRFYLTLFPMDEPMEAVTETDATAEQFLTPKNKGFPYHEVYKPVDSGQRQIRLVRLLAGTMEMPMSCEFLLSPLNLNSAPQEAVAYTAVSYCAGNPKDSAPIFLNGYSFNVFRSLFLAL
jgi:hypothetical protein